MLSSFSCLRIARESNIQAKLGKRWKDGFRKRHHLKILMEKRAITLTKDEAFLRLRKTHTYLQVVFVPCTYFPLWSLLSTQAVHKFVKPKFVANFDESPVSFNGEFTK